jgi:hypothetical protein
MCDAQVTAARGALTVTDLEIDCNALGGDLLLYLDENVSGKIDDVHRGTSGERFPVFGKRNREGHRCACYTQNK